MNLCLVTQLEPPAGTPDQIKARLSAEFPRWSIIRTDRGRWWASRQPLVSEKLGADAVDADDPDDLRAQIIAKDNARTPAKNPRGGAW